MEGVLVLHLMGHLHPLLEESGLLQTFKDVEMPSVAVMAKMELNGMGMGGVGCAFACMYSSPSFMPCTL